MTKKELGQHWLKDEDILEQIVLAANVQSSDVVLEIGPGEGPLTEKLATTGATITALEFDQDLVPKLQRKFNSQENVTILEGDIRSFDYASLPSGFKIVANIPYYLTSNLIRGFSESTNPPDTVVLLVQKEVAERICCAPGAMSMLAVVAQLFYECSLDVIVPAELFTPPPKVDSQVVIMKKRPSDQIPENSVEIIKLAKAGFANKRKTLANSLQGTFGLDKSQHSHILEAAGVGATTRAQRLSLEDWAKLLKVYKDRLSSV